jgi:hypothetical protein
MAVDSEGGMVALEADQAVRKVAVLVVVVMALAVVVMEVVATAAAAAADQPGTHAV